MQIDNGSTIVVTQRSHSVEPTSNRKYGVHRFYNFETEREKSSINKLLSTPIEVPSYLDSSFLRDDSRVRKLIKRDPSSLMKKDHSQSTLLPSIIRGQSRNELTENPY